MSVYVFIKREGERLKCIRTTMLHIRGHLTNCHAPPLWLPLAFDQAKPTVLFAAITYTHYTQYSVETNLHVRLLLWTRVWWHTGSSPPPNPSAPPLLPATAARIPQMISAGHKWHLEVARRQCARKHTCQPTAHTHTYPHTSVICSAVAARFILQADHHVSVFLTRGCCDSALILTHTLNDLTDVCFKDWDATYPCCLDPPGGAAIAKRK